MNRIRLIFLGTLALVACGDDLSDEGTTDAAVDVSDVGLVDSGDVGRDSFGVDADTVDVGRDSFDSDASDVAVEPEPEWCEGGTAHVYAPFFAEEVDLFPDGLMTREDESSPTGLRLDVTAETVPWIGTSPPLTQRIAESLNTLSGFGSLGGAIVRFSSAVSPPPASAAESMTSEQWIWADLSTNPPTRIPFDARVLDDGTTIVLWPMVPLRLGTEHAIIVTAEADAMDGGCIAPARATRSLLFGDEDEGEFDARFERVRPSYRAAVEMLGLLPEEVSVVSVFTTHDDLGPVQRAAEFIHDAPVEWGEWLGCEPRETMLQCDTSTTVLDMRDERGLVDDTLTPTEAEVPVMIWLPEESDGPVPVVVFGHGLQSDRGDGWEVARRIQEDGFAVVSMPAVEHGEHPSVLPDDDPQSLFRFLALDLATLTIDGLTVRGNMNQTNLDRLRLIRLLRTRPDLDGDGIDDIDPEQVTYIGASLGAILGPGLLALSPDLDAAVLTIGGARLASLIRDQDELLEEYAPFVELLLGPGELARLLPIMQHAIDPADAGTWAPHVLHDRFDDRLPPSVLLAVGMEDEIFSPDAGFTLARALRLPHLGPLVKPVELLELGESAPVSGNAHDGKRTLGYFQYDRVTRSDPNEPERPRHGPSARSNESGAQIRAFFRSWAGGGAPEIIDPFEVLGTPPRPEDW